MSYAKIPPPTQCYHLTARTSGRSAHYFAFPCFSWWCTIFLGTGRGSTKPTLGFPCGLGLFTRSPSCKPQVFGIWKTQFELVTGTYADTTTRTNLTLSTIVGPRTSSPSSSVFLFLFPFYCTEALIALTFQLRVCAPSYGPFWSQLGEIPGHDRIAHVLHLVGIPIPRAVLKLTQTLLVRVPCSFPSVGLMPEMP